MIEKKIKVLRDIDLNTCHGSYSLVKGEVKRVLFKNLGTFADYLKTGNFVEADKNEPEVKFIPVVLPEVDENTIVEVKPANKKEFLPTGEDTDEVLGEVGEPANKCVLEDLRRDEPSRTEEGIERAVSKDTNRMGFEEQSVEEVPVEEIPIEEQGRTEPELGLGEVVK